MLFLATVVWLHWCVASMHVRSYSTTVTLSLKITEKYLCHRANCVPWGVNIEEVGITLPSACCLYKRVLNPLCRCCSGRSDAETMTRVLGGVYPCSGQGVTDCCDKSLMGQESPIFK